MIDPKDYDTGKRKRTIKIMTIGGSGSGKTHLSATFPKCYFIITEPDGKETWMNRPELKNNVVGFEELIPESAVDTKRIFEKLELTCNEARQMAKEGKVETVVLDNMTYLAENRWIYINTYTPLYSIKGEKDTRGMYGQLSRWLYQFILMKMLSCPCNVIVNCHEMLEDQETLARKPDKTTPILANILGGFRDKADGIFSCVFYLSKVPQGKGKYKYLARTDKGSGKNAKNRYGLPEVIENVSYQAIMNAIIKKKEVK